MADPVGQQLGTYCLVRLLGQSGWASVYLGEHFSQGTQAAIKVFSPRLSGDEIGRFRAEAQALARLTHPSLCRVLDGGMQGALPFLVMEYAPGGSLRRLHPRGTVLPIMLSFLKPLAAAVQFLHDHRLIHGDIKPENLLLGKHRTLFLSDMRLAVLVQRRQSFLQQHGASLLAYLAPEQLQGQPEPASDQYALGIVVYEWLSGDVPFHEVFLVEENVHATASPVRKLPSPTQAPHLCAELPSVCERCSSF